MSASVESLHTGWLIKCGANVKSWKHRFFVLRSNNTLCYYEAETSKKAKGIINLAKATSMRGPGQCSWPAVDAPESCTPDVRIEIAVPGRAYLIFAEDKAVRKTALEWMSHLSPNGEDRPDVRGRLKSDTSDASVASTTSSSGALARRSVRLASSGSSPESSILHAGWGFKLGAVNKRWKRRYFQLRADGVLLYSKDEFSTDTPRGSIETGECLELKVPEDCTWDAAPESVDECRVEVVMAGRTYRICFDDVEGGVARWVQELDAAIMFSNFYLNDEADEMGFDEEEEDEGDPGAESGAESVESYFAFFGIPKTPLRRALLQSAVRLNKSGLPKRKLVVIYNPVSGSGSAKRIVDTTVVPVLKLAGHDFEVIATEYAGFATEHVLAMDLKEYDGVVVCGGDGMVCEILTGLLNRPEEEARDFPVGIIPVGTANAMANDLDRARSADAVSLTGRAALAVAGGLAKKVDVIEVKSESYQKYGLSCFGWGLAGAVALQADKMRWIPGQKKARYDIAGFVTLTKDWPVVCACTLAYPPPGTVGTGSPEDAWVEQEIGLVNLIATNLPKLGVDNPICKEVKNDDGMMAVAMIDQSTSLAKTVQAALGMKQGKYLANAKPVKHVIVPEFKITATPGSKGADIPFLIDGDPLESTQTAHVRILHHALNVFYSP